MADAHGGLQAQGRQTEATTGIPHVLPAAPHLNGTHDDVRDVHLHSQNQSREKSCTAEPEKRENAKRKKGKWRAGTPGKHADTQMSKNAGGGQLVGQQARTVAAEHECVHLQSKTQSSTQSYGAARDKASKPANMHELVLACMHASKRASQRFYI